MKSYSNVEKPGQRFSLLVNYLDNVENDKPCRPHPRRGANSDTVIDSCLGYLSVEST